MRTVSRPRVVAGIARLLAALALPRAASGDVSSDRKQQCLAASEQGQSQRDEGKYRAARESFVACSREFCPAIVSRACTQWLREVDDSAPTVVLGARDKAGNDVNAARVTLDGEPFAESLDGKPIAADAGEHVLRFERDGSAPVEQRLVLRAGERARVVTVTFRAIDPGPPTVLAAAATPAGTAAGGKSEAPPAEPLASARHVTAGAMALGALGVAAVGGVFLLQSNRDKDNAATLREGLASNACTHAATATCQALAGAVDSQHRELNVATALFAGAGGLVAGAFVAWFVWPKASASAWIVPMRGGVAFQLSRDLP